MAWLKYDVDSICRLNHPDPIEDYIGFMAGVYVIWRQTGSIRTVPLAGQGYNSASTITARAVFHAPAGQ